MGGLHEPCRTQHLFSVLCQVIKKALGIVETTQTGARDDGIGMFYPSIGHKPEHGDKGALHDVTHTAHFVGGNKVAESGIHRTHERLIITDGLRHPRFHQRLLDGYLMGGFYIDFRGMHLAVHSWERMMQESLPPKPKALLKICLISP